MNILFNLFGSNFLKCQPPLFLCVFGFSSFKIAPQEGDGKIISLIMSWNNLNCKKK